LGNEGPRTSDPSKYIRYIYNRVILENATVRAAAVSTLAKFGALVDSLKVFFFQRSCLLVLSYNSFFADICSLFDLQPRIFILLRRCLFDSDDEVLLLLDGLI
jgi:coatomer subunit gamma